MIRDFLSYAASVTAVLFIAGVAVGVEATDPDFPWSTDPEPITLDLALQGDPPPPVTLEQLDGKTVRWLGELRNEEAAKVVAIEATHAESRAFVARHETDAPSHRSLRLEVSFSTEPALGPVEWGEPTFAGGTTSAGETFPPAGTEVTPHLESGRGPFNLRNIARFAYPRREAKWIADLKGTITIDALHPQKARLVLDDIAALDGRTLHVAGTEDDRIHVRLVKGGFQLAMNELLAKRIIEVHVYDAQGQRIEIRYDASAMDWDYRDENGRRQSQRFPGYEAHYWEDDGPVHRVHLVVHTDAARLEIPFSLDRVRIPHADYILRDDDEAAVVDLEQTDEADRPAAHPREGDLEVVIE